MPNPFAPAPGAYSYQIGLHGKRCHLQNSVSSFPLSHPNLFSVLHLVFSAIQSSSFVPDAFTIDE
jgi:hypothetical protein